jgi:hypothetical protein
MAHMRRSGLDTSRRDSARLRPVQSNRPDQKNPDVENPGRRNPVIEN